MTFYKKNSFFVFLTSLVFINLVVKGWYIGAPSLAGDEPFSVYHAQMDIPMIIQLLSEGNNPPLFEILLHYWIQLFGISEIAVRIPSLIFSSITVGFIYAIGHRFLNQRIAVLSSIFFIFSNYHTVFAHEARVYALLGMLTVISVYFYLSILQSFKETNKGQLLKKIVLLSAVNALLIYAHYFGFFLLFVELLYLIFIPQFISSQWKNILLSIGLTLLLYSPNLAIVIQRFGISSSGTWVEKPNGIESIYNLLWSFSNAPVVTVFVIVILVSGFIKWILQRSKGSFNPISNFFIFWWIFVFFFMFSISYWIPMFIDRYLMIAAIGFIFTLAIIVQTLFTKERYQLMLSILFSILFIASVKPNISNKRNVREAVEKIQELKNNQTLIVLCPDVFDLNFIYYYNQAYFKHPDKNKTRLSDYLHSENIYPIRHVDQIEKNQLNATQQILYLDAGADFNYPENQIRHSFDQRFIYQETHHFYEIFNIYTYKTHK